MFYTSEQQQITRVPVQNTFRWHFTWSEVFIRLMQLWSTLMLILISPTAVDATPHSVHCPSAAADLRLPRRTGVLLAELCGMTWLNLCKQDDNGSNVSQDSLSLLNNSHHQNHHQWHHNTSHPPKTEWVIRRTWNWDSTASQSGMLLPRCTHTDEWTPKTQCTQPRLLDGSHKNWNLLLVLTTLI